MCLQIVARTRQPKWRVLGCLLSATAAGRMHPSRRQSRVWLPHAPSAAPVAHPPAKAVARKQPTVVEMAGFTEVRTPTREPRAPPPAAPCLGGRGRPAAMSCRDPSSAAPRAPRALQRPCRAAWPHTRGHCRAQRRATRPWGIAPCPSQKPWHRRAHDCTREQQWLPRGSQMPQALPDNCPGSAYQLAGLRVYALPECTNGGQCCQPIQ
mmetsp:Transcript_51033/g.128799  ORF Transcript_51033/g.128799 Transcript_51033/m.128799 type:complete len:209 (+) Transcript_51033:184-810(+)